MFYMYRQQLCPTTIRLCNSITPLVDVVFTSMQLRQSWVGLVEDLIGESTLKVTWFETQYE